MLWAQHLSPLAGACVTALISKGCPRGESSGSEVMEFVKVQLQGKYAQQLNPHIQIKVKMMFSLGGVSRVCEVYLNAKQFNIVFYFR